MKEIMFNGIVFKTDCDDKKHLQWVYDSIVENMKVLELNSLDEIKMVVYKFNKVVNVLIKDEFKKNKT